MRLRLTAAALLAVLAGGASARVPAQSPAAESQCLAGEAVVYSCSFGREVGSVCAAPGRIAYRFGPRGRPEIDVASMADWSNVRTHRITGGGGGYQDHVRFTAAGHDYVVFEAVAGELTEVPGRRWSGIHVQRGENDVATLDCKRRRRSAYGLSRAQDFAPTAARHMLEDTDPRFDAWF